MTMMDTNSQVAFSETQGNSTLRLIPGEFVAGMALQALSMTEDHLRKQVQTTCQQLNSFGDCAVVTPAYCTTLIDICAQARTQLGSTQEMVRTLNAEPEPCELLAMLEATKRLASKAMRHIALLRDVCEDADLERLDIHEAAIDVARQFVTGLWTSLRDYAAFVEAIYEGRRRKQQQTASDNASSDENEGGNE